MLTTQEYHGAVHICINSWTFPNVISFLGITLQHVVKGKIEVLILDFIRYIHTPSYSHLVHAAHTYDRLTKGHTGEYLAKKLIECLKEFDIDKKVCGHAVSC